LTSINNLIMITAVRKRNAKLRRRRGASVAPKGDGAGFEIISVSVPREIVRAIRAEAGKRGFSRFVARAMATELTRHYQAEFVKAAERVHGPLTEAEIREADALLEA
jgi:hypothetical protein